MRLPSIKLVVSVLLLSALASCTSKAETTVETATTRVGNAVVQIENSKVEPAPETVSARSPQPKQPPSEQPQPEQPNADQLLPFETHCYDLNTPDHKRSVQLTIDSQSNVIGAHSGYSHNRKNSYQVTYHGTVDGSLVGKDFRLNVISQVEGSLSSRAEIWRIRQRSLRIREDTLLKIDCDKKTDFERKNNFTLADLNPKANSLSIEKVYFESGKRSQTLPVSPISSGDYIIYTLNAQRDQKLSLETLQQQDINFSLVSPSRTLIGRELVYANISLPETGDYQIIIGSQSASTEPSALYIGIQ